MLVDTHAHLYDEQFDIDREVVMEKAVKAGVGKILLPNCDLSTIQPMMSMVEKWPDHCFPMMGLHPCYVNSNFKQVLSEMEKWLATNQFCAVGEVGLDYHWDTTYIKEQHKAFKQQIGWALQFGLPLVIHTRKSLADGINLIKEHKDDKLKGVFHCFSGDKDEAREIIDLGFYLGIGGVATFKNSNLHEILKEIPLEKILLETDAPYLAPVPHRGKRNESAYIPIIAHKVATIKNCGTEEVKEQTTLNAKTLFKI